MPEEYPIIGGAKEMSRLERRMLDINDEWFQAGLLMVCTIILVLYGYHFRDELDEEWRKDDH